MIGYIEGRVLFSDGLEAIICTSSGVGHQVYIHEILPEGGLAKIYISHVVRETSEELYGFKNLRDKKVFEILTKVKGVGPKSGYSLIRALGERQLIEAITFENKKLLTQAPGIGGKAAAQIVLDLKEKIQKLKMYSIDTGMGKVEGENADGDREKNKEGDNSGEKEVQGEGNLQDQAMKHRHLLIEEAVFACKELGFKEGQIVKAAHKIMMENSISKAEQLVHLVLKEI